MVFLELVVLHPLRPKCEEGAGGGPISTGEKVTRVYYFDTISNDTTVLATFVGLRPED
jgi:hypothetical protein